MILGHTDHLKAEKKLCCRAKSVKILSTLDTNCTTNPQQIDVTELQLTDLP